jgi:hypothetical protein
MSEIKRKGIGFLDSLTPEFTRFAAGNMGRGELLDIP